MLADADERDAGIASAVNNARRAGGRAGRDLGRRRRRGASTLVGDTFAPNEESVDAFHQVVVICAVLMAASGVAGALGITNPRRAVEAARLSGGQLVAVPEAAVRTSGT